MGLPGERLKAKLWQFAKLSARAANTWNKAVGRWLKEQSHKGLG